MSGLTTTVRPVVRSGGAGPRRLPRILGEGVSLEVDQMEGHVTIRVDEGGAAPRRFAMGPKAARTVAASLVRFAARIDGGPETAPARGPLLRRLFGRRRREGGAP